MSRNKSHPEIPQKMFQDTNNSKKNVFATVTVVTMIEARFIKDMFYETILAMCI